MSTSDEWHAEALSLLSMLTRLAGDAPFARRRDLRPETFPRKLMPVLYMIDVQGDDPPGVGPWVYRFRLIGEKIIDITGANWSGQTITSDLVGSDRMPVFNQAYEAVLLSRAPTRTEHRFLNVRTRMACPAVRYLFPLSDDGRCIDTLLGYMHIISEEYDLF